MHRKGSLVLVHVCALAQSRIVIVPACDLICEKDTNVATGLNVGKDRGRGMDKGGARVKIRSKLRTIILHPIWGMEPAIFNKFPDNFPSPSYEPAGYKCSTLIV